MSGPASLGSRMLTHRNGCEVISGAPAPQDCKSQAETTIIGRLLEHSTHKGLSGDAYCVLENWIVVSACWRGG